MHLAVGGFCLCNTVVIHHSNINILKFLCTINLVITTVHHNTLEMFLFKI